MEAVPLIVESRWLAAVETENEKHNIPYVTLADIQTRNKVNVTQEQQQ